jgi:proteic killer suppression protein
MILTFGSKHTQSIWKGEWVEGLPGEIQQRARRKLRMINNAQNINDLRLPPANHLEKLSGRYNGFYSIRINDQWRIVFRWTNGNATEVEILDYH